MKTFLLFVFSIILLTFPKVNFGQVAPTLGATSHFALFTAGGAFTSDGATVVTGDIASYTVIPVIDAPGSVIGTIYGVGAASDPAFTDVGLLYTNLFSRTNNNDLYATLETNITLTAGVHSIGSAAALNGDLTLDGGGNPNAIFIIQIGGALTTAAVTHIYLINSAQPCNVYWQVNNAVDLGAGSVFIGTIVAGGAITFGEAASLNGRALTTAGAIKLHNNAVSFLPAAAGTITGTASVCQGQTGVTYSVLAIANAIDYIWTLPAGASITAGTNTNNITLTYSGVAASGNITVQGSNACGNGTVSPNFAVTVTPTVTINAFAPATSTRCQGAGTVTTTTTANNNSAAIVYSLDATTAAFVGNSIDAATGAVTYAAGWSGTTTITASAAGCNGPAITTHVVTVTPTVTIAAFAPATSTRCQGAGIVTTTTTATNNSAAIVYSLDATTAAFVGNSINAATGAVTYAAGWSGTTTITASAAGCNGPAITTHVVTVNPLPAAVAGANRTICSNVTTTLGAAAVTGSTYIWSSVPAGFTSTVANPTAIPQVTTTYTVIQTITATGCTNSNSVVVTVNPVPVAVAGANRAVNLNTSTQIGAVAVLGNTYSWSSVPTGFTSHVANPTVSPLVTTTYIVVETITATGCTNNHSVVVTVNPLLAVSVSVVADANPVSAGTSVTFTATPTNGGTAPVYQWKVNGNDVGINSNTYSYVPVNTDSVTVVLTSNAVNPSGNPATSAPVTMTVNPLLPVSVSVVADANPVSEGTSVTFTATPTNGGTDPAYQWKVNGNDVGINSNTYSYLPVNTDSVTVVLTSNAVNPSGNPATSAPVTMTVNPLLAVSVSIVADANPVSSGTSVKFTATPTNGGTAPVYQWKVNDIDVGINSNTYSYVPVNNDEIKVVLNSNADNTTGSPATSAPVTMTVNPLLAVSVSIVADANPVSSGTSVKFTATPTNGGTAPVYLWKVNDIDVGINSNTYSYVPVNNDKVKVVLNSNAGAVDQSTNPATSAPVTMIVNSCPIITTEPVNQTVCAGSSVSFSVAATGNGLTYQWRKGTVNLTNGGNISGANSPTLTIDPVNISDAASNYNVVVTGTATCLANATSTDVSLIVNPTTPTIIIQPENQILCPGCPAIFSVEVTGTGLTYQWRRGTVNLIDGGNIYGATSATLIIDLVSSADVATDYNVVITGPCAPITTKNASLSLCTTTGIASLDAGNTNNVVTIYPNPFTTSIDIVVNDVSQINNCKLKIYNVLGEEVVNTIITEKLTTLVTSNLTSGIYMYKVIGNNKTIQTGKLISKQ